MTCYTKKSYQCEAVQWTGENEPDILAFIGDAHISTDDQVILMVTLHGRGNAKAHAGDWIVSCCESGFSTVSNEDFVENYQEA